jgi:hypothetical protein
MNVENQPLVEPSKILSSSMHLKVGLMKNFVKAMNQAAVVFTHLRETFPRLSKVKLKEGIFIGPQVRDLIKLLQGDEMGFWETVGLKTMRSL